MGQTRMFRDRVVSMEQTFEGGEKHLPLLKDILAEAMPGFELREHSLEHERDLFVMDLESAEGVRRRVLWTRMVLFDAERIPTLAADPAAALRAKIVELVRAQSTRPEVLVTFRHLEEGWVDTPEPRREGGGRRRRRGRGGRGAERGGGRPGAGQPPQGGRDRRPGGPPGAGQQGQRGPSPQRPGGGERRPPAPAVAAEGSSAGAGGGAAGKRRRRRRRRGGRGPGGGGPAPGPGGPPPGPRA